MPPNGNVKPTLPPELISDILDKRREEIAKKAPPAEVEYEKLMRRLNFALRSSTTSMPFTDEQNQLKRALLFLMTRFSDVKNLVRLLPPKSSLFGVTADSVPDSQGNFYQPNENKFRFIRGSLAIEYNPTPMEGNDQWKTTFYTHMTDYPRVEYKVKREMDKAKKYLYFDPSFRYGQLS